MIRAQHRGLIVLQPKDKSILFPNEGLEQDIMDALHSTYSLTGISLCNWQHDGTPPLLTRVHAQTTNHTSLQNPNYHNTSSAHILHEIIIIHKQIESSTFTYRSRGGTMPHWERQLSGTLGQFR